MTQISLMKKLYLSSALLMLATSPVAYSSNSAESLSGYFSDDEGAPASRPSTPVAQVNGLYGDPLINVLNALTMETGIEDKEKSAAISNILPSEPTISAEEKKAEPPSTAKPSWYNWLWGGEPVLTNSDKSAESTTTNVIAKEPITQETKEESALDQASNATTPETASQSGTNTEKDSEETEGPVARNSLLAPSALEKTPEMSASKANSSWFPWWGSSTPISCSNQLLVQTPTIIDPNAKTLVATLEAAATEENGKIDSTVNTSATEKTESVSETANPNLVKTKLRHAEQAFGITLADPNKSQALTPESLIEIAKLVKDQNSNVQQPPQLFPSFKEIDQNNIEPRIVTKLDSNNGNFQYFMPKEGQLYRVIMWSYEENCYMHAEMNAEQINHYRKLLADKQTDHYGYNCRHIVIIDQKI